MEEQIPNSSRYSFLPALEEKAAEIAAIEDKLAAMREEICSEMESSSRRLSETRVTESIPTSAMMERVTKWMADVEEEVVAEVSGYSTDETHQEWLAARDKLRQSRKEIREDRQEGRRQIRQFAEVCRKLTDSLAYLGDQIHKQRWKLLHGKGR